MSIEATSWAFKVKGLNPFRKIVLLALADFANPVTGIAWPCMATLAERAECSVRTAQRAVQHLERVGLLTIITSAPNGKRQTSNRFQLHLDRPQPALWVSESHPTGDSMVSPLEQNFNKKEHTHGSVKVSTLSGKAEDVNEGSLPGEGRAPNRIEDSATSHTRAHTRGQARAQAREGRSLACVWKPELKCGDPAMCAQSGCRIEAELRSAPITPPGVCCISRPWLECIDMVGCAAKGCRKQWGVPDTPHEGRQVRTKPINYPMGVKTRPDTNPDDEEV